MMNAELTIKICSTISGNKDLVGAGIDRRYSPTGNYRRGRNCRSAIASLASGRNL
jgi:hypothetical protein